MGCDDTCYTKKGHLNPSKQCAKEKCNWYACSTCPECPDEDEPQCDTKTCYNPNNGNFKDHKCSDMYCAACPECDAGKPEEELTCSETCFSKRSGDLRPELCSKDKCAGCSGC